MNWSFESKRYLHHFLKIFSPTFSQEIPSEVEVRYKQHECYNEMKQYREAISVLELISTKQRNAKVNMALAKLYQRTGMDRSAVTSYKEVLRYLGFPSFFLFPVEVQKCSAQRTSNDCLKNVICFMQGVSAIVGSRAGITFTWGERS